MRPRIASARVVYEVITGVGVHLEGTSPTPFCYQPTLSHFYPSTLHSPLGYYQSQILLKMCIFAVSCQIDPFIPPSLKPVLKSDLWLYMLLLNTLKGARPCLFQRSVIFNNDTASDQKMMPFSTYDMDDKKRQYVLHESSFLMVFVSLLQCPNAK